MAGVGGEGGGVGGLVAGSVEQISSKQTDVPIAST